jgi:hypothetical protein
MSARDWATRGRHVALESVKTSPWSVSDWALVAGVLALGGLVAVGARRGHPVGIGEVVMLAVFATCAHWAGRGFGPPR